MASKDRLLLDVSVESYELIKRALDRHLAEMAKDAVGFDIIGDQEAFKAAQKDYFHGKNLLVKMDERRSIVEEG